MSSGGEKLTNEEIEACREAFQKFDFDCSGAIDSFELRSTLQSMGQQPTDRELFDLIAEMDADGSGTIDFPEFLNVMVAQKKKLAAAADESDTLDAFVALGGGQDKSGDISADKLRKVVREFGLTIDIETLIREVDTDKSGFIDYDEFRRMMT